MTVTITKPKGALVALSIFGWGGQISLSTENEQVKELINLVPHEYLLPMTQAKGVAYRCLDGLSLPFPVRGVRYIPEAMIQQAETRLQEASEVLREAAAEFTAPENWGLMLATSRSILKDRFPENKVPDPQEVYDSFRLQYAVFSVEASPFDVAGALNVDRLMAQFRAEAYQTLVSQLHKLLADMAKRLTEGKRFHASTIEKLGSWLEAFPHLASAIEGSTEAHGLDEVRRIVSQAQSCLAGVVPEDLRTSASLRESVGGMMDSIREQLRTVAGPEIDSVGRRALEL